MITPILIALSLLVLLAFPVLALCFVARESRVPSNPFSVRPNASPSDAAPSPKSGNGELSPALTRDLHAPCAGPLPCPVCGAPTIDWIDSRGKHFGHYCAAHGFVQITRNSIFAS